MKTSVATVLLIGGAQASFGSAALRGHAGSSPSSFKKFDDKGCRTSSGSAGKEGVDYMLFKHVSKEKCKFKCVDLDTKCTGWEYSTSGKCEVWKKPIDKHELAYVHGLDCYIKKEESSADGDDEAEDRSTSFKKFDDKGCRTSSGSAGEEGIDYKLFKHVSKETCKFKCIDLDAECTGWEYAKGGKCEVWKKHIDKHELAYVHGLDCYIKKSGPNRRHLVKTNATSEDDVEEWNY